jgi:hypothetical protein
LSPHTTAATRSASPGPAAWLSKARNDAKRWVAAIAVVHGMNDTDSCSVRFRHMRAGSAALMNRVVSLCAIHTPSLNAKLTE